MISETEKNPAANWFDLKLDRQLLDSSFEGYKLSLEVFDHYKLDLTDQLQLDTYNFIENNATDKSEPVRHKVYAYQHLKLFGLQNHLIINHFNDSNIYYFDIQHRLVKINYKPNRSINITNLKLSNVNQVNRVNPTMRFFTEKSAVVFDGFNKLNILEELNEENWITLFDWIVDENIQASLIKDVVLFENQLHVLLMNVEEINNKFQTFINWFSFEINNNGWCFKRLRKIDCFSYVPDYVCLETNGASIYIVGPSLIKFSYDSDKPVIIQSSEAQKQVAEVEINSSNKKYYTWNQTDDEINMNIKLAEYEIKSKNDLFVNIESGSIQIKTVKNNEIILNESFFSNIKVDESIWTLNTSNKSLEIMLIKSRINEVWSNCLKDGDKYGEYETKQIDLKFTSELQTKENESRAFSTLDQELEECDGLIDDQVMGNLDCDEKLIMIRRLDGELHNSTDQCYINDNKYLFDVKLSANKSPALCLRHDVDGILWQPHRISNPSPNNTIWLTHEHTYFAFGYVQASKQDTKYRSSSPDCSYVCIVDTIKHVYVYKQDSETQGCVLKNRKTGKIVNHIGKQYLISLDNDNECYGLYCSNNYIILILREACYLFKI